MWDDAMALVGEAARKDEHRGQKKRPRKKDGLRTSHG
jgi:hypothetical protein